MIELPWLSAEFSGHNKGNWRWKHWAVADARKWAHQATLAAGIEAPLEGDIQLHVLFVPPDDRSDRINLPNRMKPYFDGIADALKVNDRRFAIPTFEMAEPRKPGKVIVTMFNKEDENAPVP